MTPTPDTFLYDAFLSYRNCEPDRDFAWRLLARLESAGLKLAIDRRDFKPAATFLEEMERCVKESRFTLAVLSPRYFESGNTWEEAILCKVLDMGERRRRLIPLLLEPVERPVWLYDIVGVDFSDPQALVDPHARLLAALGASQRVQAADEGPEPRYADATTHALAKAMEESLRREQELLSRGADATAVRREILELRRQLREGGRLQAGDFLADGRFQLVEPIGRGGFATVWKAFDRREREVVALKVLHGQFAEDRSRRERFFRGAREMEELHHPGIVRVTEKHLVDGGYHFYTMEYLKGGDLREAVLGKRLAPAALLPLLQEVAAALSFAHENDVIHRDVKPANILLDAEGHAKLTDFDLVRAANSTGGTLEGGMLGTFLYSAPETMSAPQDAGVAADVYSLGMTVVFCLYGADLPLEVLQEPGTFLRALPCSAGLQEVLRRAIALRPEGRFGSVAELSRALAEGVTSPASAAISRLRSPDPTRSEVELQVAYVGITSEVFWAADGTVNRSLLGPGGMAEPTGEILQGGILDLERPFVLVCSEASPAFNVLTLRIGNSGKAERGLVEVVLVPRLIFEPGFGERMHLRPGRALADLLRFHRLGEPVDDLEPSTPQLRIRDGESPQTVDLRIDTSTIERIDGAVIEAGKCRVEVDLHFSVKDDRGRESTRELRLQLPMELEQPPGHNWLSIDFGASAIAVAAGNTLEDSFRMIPLQDIAIRRDGRTYGQEDSANPEALTPFLPSWVICNADLRQEVLEDDIGWRAGYPFFRPASLLPGDASFLGLPALSSQLQDSPGRVVFSPMSWLGKGAREIRLQEDVKFLRQGQVVMERALPLDAVIESSFAALAEGYLHGQRVDQVVICHPNTFTSHHCRRLHSIASRALTKPFGIGSPKHIRLVSESDAVAYYYCSRRMRQEPREGKEKILVYDFKGEALDLSILLIEWSRIPFYPSRCSMEARMGLPIAGSYLDELLARMVDELLRDSGVMSHGALQYAFPIVAEVSENDTALSLYRNAILELYSALKEAKNTWDGRSPFVLRVGGIKGGWGVVRCHLSDGPVPDAAANPDRPGLFAQGEFLYLSVPAERVHKDSRLAEYLEFVTETVIAEVLLAAGLGQNEIDTLIVLGRDELWPGLRERLRACLPSASIPDIGFGITPKEVVARGAIARQKLVITEETSPAGRRLGVLVANGTLLVPEEEWGRGRAIDLTSSPSFRLVQVGLRNPDPRRDMQSLRRHFYIDLSSRVYLRESLWREDPRLFVEKVQRGGKEVIALRNSKNQELIVDDLEAGTTIPTRPPWPIGDVLLRPER